MDKKIITICLGIFIIATIFLLGSNFQKKESNNEYLEETTSLTGTVLSVLDNYVTIQDKDNIIYTFLIDNLSHVEIGENIRISYKGKLDKNIEKQENKIVSYEVLETVNDYTSLLDDNGIFKKFYEVAYNKLNKMTLDEKIGQVLLVRVPSNNQIETLKKYQFGGYLLFARDFKDKSKTEVINMITSYQDNSKIPLLIASDEEGGKVSRISSNSNLVKTPFKSSRELYEEGGFKLIFEDTLNKSKILDELKINLNLAPVVDVSTDESDYMYERSIGLSSELTSTFAREVIKASKEGSVSYTLKHFPGYGNNEDTHLGLSVDKRSLESIKEIDLPPFKAGIEEGAEAVLVSHNIVEAIDKDMPASLSVNVHNLLRNELSFTGVIITDDLSMKAISDNYNSTGAVEAIKVGNDLLIVTDYENSYKEIKYAIETNDLSIYLLDKIVLRNLAWKYYKGLMIPNQK